MARFLAFLLLSSCTTTPLKLVRYHGICKEKTAWCREVVDILFRFEKGKVASKLEASCELSRLECSEMDTSTQDGKLSFGTWEYINDICKISPMALIEVYEVD